MKRRTVGIIVAVLAVGIIGVFAVLRMQTKADTVPVMSDSVETAQGNIVEEPEQKTEQLPPVTEEEPEQTEETAPAEPEQDDTEQEETDVAEEEPNTETIDKALTDITALDKIMYAQSAVNTRSGPSTEYERVGGLTTNEEVHVTGQSNLTSWYQIDVDGVTQFVSNNYLADAKVEVQEPAQTASSNNSNQTSTAGFTPEALAILEKNGASPELAAAAGMTSESIVYFDSLGLPISFFGDIPKGEKHDFELTEEQRERLSHIHAE